MAAPSARHRDSFQAPPDQARPSAVPAALDGLADSARQCRNRTTLDLLVAAPAPASWLLPSPRAPRQSSPRRPIDPAHPVRPVPVVTADPAPSCPPTGGSGFPDLPA